MIRGGDIGARMSDAAGPQNEPDKVRFEQSLHPGSRPGVVLSASANPSAMADGTGRFLLQITPGERKSGMPHSIEIPAPVNGRMTLVNG